jgi:hypothetical protein
MTDNSKPGSELEIRRAADFISRYANNMRFESYGSDLKILFGESDQASGKEVIEQHTAITASWPQVKLAAYYLQVQLLVYEADLGRPIAVHPVSIPPPFPDEVPPESQNDPHAKDVLERLRALREQFISSLGITGNTGTA